MKERCNCDCHAMGCGEICGPCCTPRAEAAREDSGTPAQLANILQEVPQARKTSESSSRMDVTPAGALCSAEKVEQAGAKSAVESAATPDALARQFHETYERLAPQFGYETRKESAKPWSDVPENNKRLMIAVCAEILERRAVNSRDKQEEKS